MRNLSKIKKAVRGFLSTLKDKFSNKLQRSKKANDNIPSVKSKLEVEREIREMVRITTELRVARFRAKMHEEAAEIREHQRAQNINQDDDSSDKE